MAQFRYGKFSFYYLTIDCFPPFSINFITGLHHFILKYESNARFVKWKDGSLQLLIGNEVLDISVHESTHDQSHLFLRHGKVNLLTSSFILFLSSVNL
jgi:Leo1-like protein